MMLISESISTIIVLVTRPFSLFKIACILGTRTIFVIILTWVELVSAAICFHVNILWSMVVWVIALISLPARVLTSLQTVKMLDQRLHEMQTELENLTWSRKELEERIKMITKERTLMEALLGELEGEHEKAILKIESLEGELQDLKKENLLLKEIRGEERRRIIGQGGKGSHQDVGITDRHDVSLGIPSWKSLDGSQVVFQDFLIPKDVWEDVGKSKYDYTRPKPVKTPMNKEEDEGTSEVIDRKRGTALSQSVFSSLLSLLVGVIIWEAEDPCMPLVVALFTVVGMSLKSVVHFFYSIKNKPASDAVALLSLNWFILGSLTYPTLPRLARMLAPVALSFVGPTESASLN